MTLKEKIADVQAAYKVLKQFVNDDTYFAYLQGLIEAREIEVKDREQISRLEQALDLDK